MDEKKEQDIKFLQAKKAFSELTDKQREEIMSDYCVCGNPEKCYCQRDD